MPPSFAEHTSVDRGTPSLGPGEISPHCRCSSTTIIVMPDSQTLAVIRPIATGGDSPAQPLTIRDSDDRIVIGRSAEADWQLADPRVSRRHAMMSVVGRAVIIRDLKSRHGTVINGSRLAPGGETSLREGDSIQFGGVRCVVDPPLPRPLGADDC
jgi:hypothetical protein